MSSNEQKKILANHIHNIVGGQVDYTKYVDNRELSYVHLMTMNDVPEVGVNTYVTVGVSENSIDLVVDDIPLRVELMISIDKKQEKIGNVLATCAFCIINSHYKCMPGNIFYDIIGSYVEDSQMKHIMFVQPFLWEDTYKELKLSDKIVEWLLAVPISENESKYAEEHGSDALEELLEKNNIDIFDLYRESVL